MQIEFGTPWVDHDFAGVVVEKEGYMHALRGHLDPLLAASPAFPLPDQRAEVITRALGDGRDHRIRSHGEAAEFDHSHGCATNLGDGSIENQVPALQHAEAIEEKIQAGAKSHCAPEDRANGICRIKYQRREDQWSAYLDEIWTHPY